MKSTIPLEYCFCDYCNGNKTKELYRIPGASIKIPFSIVRCLDCGLIYVNPRPAVELTKFIYTSEYYAGEGLDPSFLGSSPDKTTDANLLLDSLTDKLGCENFILVEVGGGEGVVSFEAKRREGITVLMTDLSEAAINSAREKGINALHGDLSDARLDDLRGKVDVIVATEVIEHVYEPKLFLSNVFHMLRPGGIFYFTTGNFSETRFLGSRWGYMQIPDAHLYFFSKNTMSLYLRDVGFTSFVPAYDYYVKNNVGRRFLKSLGVKVSDVKPSTKIEKFLYKVIFRGLEFALGRSRYDWAVK